MFRRKRQVSIFVVIRRNIKDHSIFCVTNKTIEQEKQLDILYQKQGQATQFSSKVAYDKWLQKEINDLGRVHSPNMFQVTIPNDMF